MRKVAVYISLILLCLSTVLLIGLQVKLLGWMLLVLGLLSLCLCSKQFAKDIVLLYVSIAILGLTPITTDISYSHIFIMGTALALAVGIPYGISRYAYKDYLVRFPFYHGRRWYRTEFAYIAVTTVISYLVIPFYLKNTGAYLNWTVEPGLHNITKLFIGTNGLGIWDELFFVSTVLGILRRHIAFWLANVMQAILFTSFLFELGFTGWGPFMIYPFALLQGLIFRKTESLLYIITIHLCLDFVLFLALLNTHHPDWLPIFISGK